SPAGWRLRSSFSTPNGGNFYVNTVVFLPSSVAASPTLLTFAGGVLTTWDVAGGEPLQRASHDFLATARGLAVSSTGDVVIGRATGEVQLFHPDALLAGTTPAPYDSIP